MTRLSMALDQLAMTRKYTHMVLEHTPTERWSEMPGGLSSHVTWQVGHITWAQANQVVGKICAQPWDGLVPDHYGKLFGKGSTPLTDAKQYPTPAQLLESMQRVHERALSELDQLDEGVMNEAASHSTGMIHNKFDLLMWVVRHEMLHIGQVGLIRRQLGMEPYR